MALRQSRIPVQPDRTDTPVRSVAQVRHIFHGVAFGPETLESLCLAYEIASRSLHDGQRRPLIVNETLALRIIRLAEQGERDPLSLASRAFEELGFQPPY